MASLFIRKNSPPIIYGQVIMKYKAYNAKKIYNVRLSKNNLKKGLMPPHPAIFIKREQFFKNGFFNKKYRSAADFDLLCNYLLKDTDHITIDKEIAIFYSGGISSNKSISYDETSQIIKNHFGLYSYISFYIKKIIIEQSIKKILSFLGLLNIYYKVYFSFKGDKFD